jgi:hypothetical protein
MELFKKIDPQIQLIGYDKSTGVPIYKLLESYTYKNIIVPKGFITDLASIPRLFHYWISPTDIIEASIIHDYLIFGIPHISKNYNLLYNIDKIFYDIMKCKNNKFIATYSYAGVRLYKTLDKFKCFSKHNLKLCPIEKYNEHLFDEKMLLINNPKFLTNLI